MRLALLERLLAVTRDRGTAALATDLATGAQRLVTSDGDDGELQLGTSDLAQLHRAFDEGQSGTINTEFGPVFVEVWSPKLRLIVVGAVHTAQALVPMAQLAGYEVIVIDPRTAFCTPVRFPDTALSHAWPDAEVPARKPDRRTAVVTLTHDAKIDDPALEAALRSDAFYIGALGSRRTHAKRAERLAAAGFDAAAIARVRGPVGLAIGAFTPGEIALSIMAEITAVLRRAPLASRAA